MKRKPTNLKIELSNIMNMFWQLTVYKISNIIMLNEIIKMFRAELKDVLCVEEVQADV